MVPPTVTGLDAAAATRESHWVTGCTTATDATVGTGRGVGANASLEIHLATGAATETSQVVRWVVNPSEAMAVARSRRWRVRSVWRRRTRSGCATGKRLALSGSSMVRVWVVTRVARSTANPTATSTPRTRLNTPASARPSAPTSTRREMVVSAPSMLTAPKAAGPMPIRSGAVAPFPCALP
jgi:hypothetical protein